MAEDYKALKPGIEHNVRAMCSSGNEDDSFSIGKTDKESVEKPRYGLPPAIAYEPLLGTGILLNILMMFLDSTNII